MSADHDGLKPKSGPGTVIAVKKQGHGASAVVHATTTDEPSSDKPLPQNAASSSRSAAPRSLLEMLCVTAVVLLALLCLSWTLWLMLLTAWPTATVNRLMDTSDLDVGAFWRLSEAPKAVAGVGLVGLGAVALGYVVVLGQITLTVMGLPKQRPYDAPTAPESRLAAKSSGSLATIRTRQEDAPPGSRRWSAAAVSRTASRLASDVMDRESKTRRNMHSLIKVADVAIQCVLLAQLLEGGMAVSLIGVFAATVALNALGAAVMFVLPHLNMGRAQLLVDTAFDFVVAMAFPMLVATYALTSFTFDKTLMAINSHIFPPGYFELIASVVADPIEVEVVRSTLDALRIDSVVKIFTRVGTSAALCRRFFGLAGLLRSRGAAGFPNIYPRRHRPLAALFLAVAVAVVVVTTGSVTTSSSACAMHPECVQIARRWISARASNDATRCPCLAMIDRNIAIATYDEWDKPFDRTEKLAQLASSGDLRTLQLVNRALPTFPEQLRGCKNLKHVALIYTETVVMPDWFAELTKLEFLHIEGKSIFQSLQHLPERLFDDMEQLVFIHLGFQALRRLPSLDGLTNLKTINLGALFVLAELPSFAKLHKLERIMVAATPGIEVFPDLTNVRGLQLLIVADRGAYCCNGFLGADRCDLTRSLCQQHLSGAPAITQCLAPDRMATPATRAYFDRFPFSACFGEAARPGDLKLSPTREEMTPCNGSLFRACQAPGTPPGTPAMCYNTRWMAVACDPSPFPMEMRRRQIALGRGAPCDPAIEAWLGCTGTSSKA